MDSGSLESIIKTMQPPERIIAEIKEKASTFNKNIPNGENYEATYIIPVLETKNEKFSSRVKISITYGKTFFSKKHPIYFKVQLHLFDENGTPVCDERLFSDVHHSLDYFNANGNEIIESNTRQALQKLFIYY